jgi:hypothetical protein
MSSFPATSFEHTKKGRALGEGRPFDVFHRIVRRRWPTSVEQYFAGRAKKGAVLLPIPSFLIPPNPWEGPYKRSWSLSSHVHPGRLSENPHLSRFYRDYPHPSSLRRTDKYASFLSISDALHLSIFQQPPEPGLSDRLLD